MILGRIVWGIVKFGMVGFDASQFGWSVFVSGAILTAIPGIILQLILIPILVTTLNRNRN